MASDKELAAVYAGLTDEERARLPGKLRALDRPKSIEKWAKAKAERDEAIAAAMERVEEEQLDAKGKPYTVAVERYRDPETGPAAVAAAKERWQKAKATLLNESEG